MGTTRRRQAGEGGISEYQTKAGPRFLIKYPMVQEDGTKRVVLKRGYKTRREAAAALRAEIRKTETGEWVPAPGKELFAALRKELGDIAVIAEDLGTITPDVHALRDELGLPGMRVLQFAFGGTSDNTHLPHNYDKNTVVYTGTHDNDTVAGWFSCQPGEGSTLNAEQIERERNYCRNYLSTDGMEINWDFIRAAMASVADISIIQLQDVLGLGSQARMNIPASEQGNWGWRYTEGALTSESSARLKELAAIYGRNVE